MNDESEKIEQEASRRPRSYAWLQTFILIVTAGYDVTVFYLYGAEYPHGILSGYLNAYWKYHAGFGVLVFAALLALVIWNRSRASRTMVLLVLAASMGSLVISALIALSNQTSVFGYFEMVEGQKNQGEYLSITAYPKGDKNIPLNYGFRSDSMQLTFKQGAKLDKYEVRGRAITSILTDPHEEAPAVVSAARPLKAGAVKYIPVESFGFAAILQIAGENGATQEAAVFLPPYLRTKFAQDTNFFLPGSAEKYRLELVYKDGLYAADEPWSFEVPKNAAVKVTYVTDQGFQTVEARPERSLDIPGQKVKLVSIERWFGMLVVFDPYARAILPLSGILCLIALAVILVQGFKQFRSAQNQSRLYN